MPHDFFVPGAVALNTELVVVLSPHYYSTLSVRRSVAFRALLNVLADIACEFSPIIHVEARGEIAAQVWVKEFVSKQ